LTFENITSIDFVTLQLVLRKPKPVVEKRDIESLVIAVEAGSPIPSPPEQLEEDFVHVPQLDPLQVESMIDPTFE